MTNAVRLYVRNGKDGGFATELSPMGRVTLWNGTNEMQVTEGTYGQYTGEEWAMNDAERWRMFLGWGIELYQEPDEPLYTRAKLSSRAEQRFGIKPKMVP
jgi:hypothetical protein